MRGLCKSLLIYMLPNGPKKIVDSSAQGANIQELSRRRQPFIQPGASRGKNCSRYETKYGSARHKKQITMITQLSPNPKQG